MDSTVCLPSSAGNRYLAPPRRLTHVPQPQGLTRQTLTAAARAADAEHLWAANGRYSPWLPHQPLIPARGPQPAQAVGNRPRTRRSDADSSTTSPSPPSRTRNSRQRQGDADSPAPPARERRQPPRQSRRPQAPQPPPSAPAASARGGPVQVGQELELECARLALEGKGVCLLPPTGFVVLVERALPGEVLRAQVTSVKRGYAEARKVASLSPHRNAVQAPCPYFGPCGGCTLQSLQYEAQLAEKRNQVEQTLRRVGRLGPSLDSLAAEAEAAGSVASGGGSGSVSVAPTVGCVETIAYRNKMMFHFSSRCWLPPDAVEDRPCLGLLRPGSVDVVLPVVRHGCKLQDAPSNELLARAEELVSEAGLLPYNDPSGTGSMKHLIIRSGSGVPSAPGSAASAAAAAGAKELMLVFGVTHGSAVKRLKPVAEALGREFPQLASVVAQVVAPPQPNSRGAGGASAGTQPRQRQSRGGGRGRGPRDGGGDQLGQEPPPAAVAAVEEEDEEDGSSSSGPITLLYGKPYIHDVICGLTFQISPGSFFQTNSRQAEVLYDVVRRAAALRPGAVDTVLDLYCGTGTIGLSLARDCRRVVGVDVVESAVEDARRNAALNDVTNAAFLCSDVNALDRRLAAAPAAAEAAEPLAVAEAAAPTDLEAEADAVLRPDVVIVDPARGGLSLGAAAFLSRCGARRVVYVSCNVATQARDLDRLVNGPTAPFRLVSVQPVDMFPHTDHVETVTVLERRVDVAPAAAGAAVTV